ncbi:MAG: ASKHA domain-containing protein [Dehalococcoidia bacterium]|nr:ASKHA domain-containing protein [Dehalococcoidia bacterium]
MCRGTIDDGKTIMEASQELGVPIEGVCGAQALCGKCQVRIKERLFAEYGMASGSGAVSPLSESEKKLLSDEEKRQGYRLACQTHVHGDIMVFVPEQSRGQEQIVRKQATPRTIELKPAVRKYCVEMAPPTLRDSLGDWDRLRIELHRRFNLSNLTIDFQVMTDLQKVVRQGNWIVSASVWMDNEVIRVEPGHESGSYGIAVDIGTTTLAGYLCDLESGEVVATESMMNPQAVYGDDVMTRISYTMGNQDGRERMNQVIIEALNQLVRQAAARAGIEAKDIIDMTVVGNTCMHHFFLNLDPQHIAKTPFTPAICHSLNVKARDLGLKISPGAYVHVLPIEAGFVGADNVGVLLAEEPYHQDDIVLILDIGTNGELILGNRDSILSASCATGPAFEGASIRHGMRAAVGAIERIEIAPDTKEVRFQVIGKEGWNTNLPHIGAKGICGSGVIDAIAQLLVSGVIGKTGRFNEDLESARFRVIEGEPEFVIAWADETSIGRDIVICQSDIRQIQLAKGIMYAGARIMMQHLGVEILDKVILAGAFGSCINQESAAIIGLFPDCALENICAVGNAAGDGARIALLNVDKRAEAENMARKVEYMQLALVPDLARVFGRAMWFPHMHDSFPLLTGSGLGKTME